MAQFLLAVFSTRRVNLITQIFCQVAKILDSVALEGGTKNPMDITETLPTVGSKSPQDKQLMNKLTLGEGMGSGGDRVCHPGQHIKSWQMVTEEGQQMRTLHHPTLNESLLVRLEQVVESIFKRVRHVNIAMDGSRHGCKDASYMILGGFHQEKYRVHCGVMASRGSLGIVCGRGPGAMRGRFGGLLAAPRGSFQGGPAFPARARRGGCRGRGGNFWKKGGPLIFKSRPPQVSFKTQNDDFQDGGRVCRFLVRVYSFASE